MNNTIFFLLILVAFASCKTKDATTYDKPVRTVVAGKVLHPQKEIKNVSLAINRVGFPQEELEAQLDSTGSFLITFPTYVPVDAWLIYKVNTLIVLRPGDSLYVELDGTHNDRPELLETIRYGGTAAAINKPISDFQKQYFASSLNIYASNKLEEVTKNYDPERFRAFADSLRDEETKFLDTFIRQNEPDEFVQSWASNTIYEDYYSILTFYPIDHRKANVLKQDEWNVPLSYYSYFKEPHPIDAQKDLQSGNAIRSYLDKYLSYMWRLTRDDMKAIKNKSATTFDSIVLKKIMGNTSPGLFRESMITHVFSGFIEESKMESFEKFKSIADSNVRSAFLREPLFKRYDLAKAELAKSEDIATKKVESLNTLLDGLFSKKKGKVVYVDIWATWCGPCIDEFPYSKQLYEQFHEQVEFVYLCIDSDEAAYKNVLKKYHLQGNIYFLNKEQSDEVKGKLQLNGVPYYMLIDKDGKVVANGFEMRPSEEGTAEEMRGLIEG